MISRIHSKLGTAGLVVAIVALVVALTGVAFAAMPGLNSKQKKQVKAIAKQYAGKDGANGAPGPTGPTGPKGDTGSEGKQGIQGIPGEDGEDGEDGENGEDGTCSGANPECILPSGATETGTWAVGPGGVPEIAALPFNIPLEEAPEAMYYVNKEGEEQSTTAPITYHAPANCLGSAAEPSAPAGVVCVYASKETRGENAFEEFIEGLIARTPTLNAEYSNLYTSGATLFFTGEEGIALGTYAVTAK